MALNATNFIVQGPIRSADMKQFVDLFTGVMTDQPVTFKNAVMIGGSQGSSTPPLKLFGVAGQTGNLIELYPSAGAAAATFGFGAVGNFAWGPGSPAANDTFLSRIALQNGHATDTAGILIDPYLEVVGNVKAGGYIFGNNATISAPPGTPFLLEINQDLTVERHIWAKGRMSVGVAGPTATDVGFRVSTDSTTGISQYGVLSYVKTSPSATTGATAVVGRVELLAGTYTQTSTIGLATHTPIWNGNAVTTNSYGVYVSNPAFAGKVTNAYSVYIEAPSGASGVNIGIYNGGSSLLYGNVAVGESPVGQTEIFVVAGYARIKGGILYVGNDAGGGSVNIGGVIVQKWLSGQIRVAGNLTCAHLDIESDKQIGFAVNGYLIKGISGQPILTTTGNWMVQGGNLYLDAAMTSRIWWDGGSSTVKVNQNFGFNSGRAYWGATNQSFLEMWNAGELRVSSTPGNFYTMGIIGAGGVYVDCSGGPCRGNGAYVNTASSQTVKKNVATLDSDACLDRVAALRPVSFEYTTPRDFGPKSEPITTRDQKLTPLEWTPEWLGFIAEEVAQVVPEAVGVLDDGEAGGLVAENLIPVLWGAVRALNSRIQALEGAAA